MRDESIRYELLPIGSVIEEGVHTRVCILKQFRPAMKYLELFSHVLVYYEGRDKRLKLGVFKMIRIDGETGILETDGNCLLDGFPVFDLKPYFPCEDRVKGPRIPEFMKDWSEWRNGELSLEGVDNLLKGCGIQTDGGYFVNPAGFVRKKEGRYYLELEEAGPDIFLSLKDFSHIRVLWWFDRYDRKSYRKVTQADPPYENAPRTGIFATRSPVRPNPIATTTCRILSLDQEKKTIRISGLDAFDGSPVIAVLPYIPSLDRVREYSVPEWLKHWPEWLDDREETLGGMDMDSMVSDMERIKRYSLVSGRSPREEFTLSAVTAKDTGNSAMITVKGARQNNLKNIDCEIPKNRITVITGVSGSGKSSLAFDTIYSESQRRFMDSMSISGFLNGQMEKADFDEISGLPPAIAIEQKAAGRNPRSTVGTMTDIYDYLSLLYTKIGIRHCPECKRAIIPLRPDEIVSILKNLIPGTVFYMYPFKKDQPSGEFAVPYGMCGEDTDACADEFIKRLKNCLERSLIDGSGAVTVRIKEEEFLFQTKEMCFHCNHIFFELTASAFRFNNPESMCPVCKGMGIKLEVDPGLIVSNPDLSILDGASEWWGDLRKFRKKPNANWMKGEILALAEEMKIDTELPWKELPDSFKNQALYGSGGHEIHFTYENTNGRKGEIVRPAEGAYNSITRLFRENGADTAARIARAFMREKTCDCCNGERLSAEGRLVSIAGIRFPEAVRMTAEELKKRVSELPGKLTDEELQIAAPVLRELDRRLENLIRTGLSYLTLDRSVPTLSGGEFQRLRLAAQLGSRITNVLYVLDEPSAGLHAKDHEKVILAVKQIRDAGNTVIVVEHDARTMLEADRIIDIGPGAGIHGGKVVACGTPEEVMGNPGSETGRYLLRLNQTDNDPVRQCRRAKNWIRLKGARHNNLKNIDVEIPLGVFTCVTGVSGSGKSSLISKILYPAIARYLKQSDAAPGDYDSLEGLEQIDGIVNITQQAIGRTPRSNPATYTGVFDEIRKVFALTEEAKKKGYKQNSFSFNSKDGQCEACGGEGRRCVPMHFMPDIWVECTACRGRRYKKEILEIHYNGRTIADVLDMNMEEASEVFAGNHKITAVLNTLNKVGLGYLKLGQSALTLSGGEAQRIKLAKELSRPNTGRTIYLLDEPTTGLHFSDVGKLLSILHDITEAGNTVLVIEHNTEVIKEADWIIDLGPEGGNAGGYLVAQGTPEEVSKQDSYTGYELKRILADNIH